MVATIIKEKFSFLVFIILVFLVGPLLLSAQNITVKGVVVDSKNNEPLAFVNILSGGGWGATTDIDGKFIIKTDGHNCCLKLTYVGYEPLNYKIDYTKERQHIVLNSKIFDLEEVKIFPGENPAHRIINNVIANRDLNNPSKLNAFTYTSYDKMVLTVDADSIMKKDSVLLDTNELKVRKFLEKQDMFLMETVTERKYIAPGLNQENVLATRVSGFNDPVMAFMISQIQSTSFYDEMIQVAGNDYINPISKGSTSKYFFLIEDTIWYNSTDTVFIISFRPMKNTKFQGMKGFLHINSKRWAIQNVKAEPLNDTTGITIRIQQGYEFIQEHWFPVQLNTDIIFRMASANDGKNNYPLIGHGRSYIRDIDLSPDLQKKDFSYHEVEIEEGATKRKGEYWKEYRTDSLTERELETYRVIDSIGKADNFDKTASTFQTLLTGKIPLGFINIDIDKFIHYNDYEGLYLGMGIHTNQKLSKKFSTGGFWGYGFRDKAVKYGVDFTVTVHKPSESTIRVDAYNKVTASGNTQFFDDKFQVWRPEYFYEFFFTQMNTTIGADINYTFRIKPLRDFSWNMGGQIQKKEPYNNYYFTNSESPGNFVTTFNTTQINLGFRFAFREKIFQTTKGQVSLGSKYPIIWFNYSKGIQGFIDGEFSYDRIDLKVEYSHYFKYIGESSFSFKAGLINGQLPISNLYCGVGTYSIFTIYAPGSFGTMRPNEFYSDRYVSLFLTHNFKNLLFSFRNYKPELMLVTNIAVGSLNNPKNHHNIDFNTLENGYYESGIVIRKLLNLQLYDLGLGVLYRYGPYGLDTQAKNFAYKISLYYAF